LQTIAKVFWGLLSLGSKGGNFVLDLLLFGFQDSVRDNRLNTEKRTKRERKKK